MSKLPKVLAIFGLMGLSAAAFAYYGTESHVEAAKGLFQIGSAVNAESDLLEALEKNPFDIEAWTLLGDFYSEEGRLDEALTAYDRASTLSGGGLTQTVKRLMVLVRLENTSAAESSAMAMTIAHPENVEALRVLGWIAIKRAGSGPAGLDGTNLDKEQLSEAARRFEEALRIKPLDAEASIGLAVVAALDGRHTDAIALLDRSVAMDSQQYWALQLLGDELRTLGRDDEAKVAYERAQLLAQDRPYSLMELAELARRRNEHAVAAEYMSVVGPSGAYNRAIDHLNAGNLPESERGFMEALLVDPEDGLALDRLEEVRILLYPASDTRRLELAARRIADGEKAEEVHNSLRAFKDYRRAIRLAPQLSEARLQMARFLDKEGAYTLAVMQLQRVEELTRSQNERLIASDMMEVITRKALSEMEQVHKVRFGNLWDEPTSVLGDLIGNPETLEARIRWGVNSIPRPRARIAILPFEESKRSVHVGVERLAAEWLGSTLQLLPGFEIVSRDEIAAAVSARLARSAAELDPGVLGRDLRADIVIRGDILEEPERVEIRVEAIKVPAGPVIWNQTFSFGGPDALNRAILEIARSMGHQIPLKGMVIRRQEGERMTINLGRVHGVRVGDTVAIFREGDQLFVPGLDWPGKKENLVGIARVTALTERYGEIAAAPDVAGLIRAGDIIRRHQAVRRETAVERLVRRTL